MKLNIQLFAGETQKVNTDELNAVANEIQKNVEEMTTLIKEISEEVMSLQSEGAYDSEAGKKLQEALNKVKEFINGYSDDAQSFGTYLKQVAEKYGITDASISKEISAWADTVQAAIATISGGLNSTVEKGSYSVGSYFTDMSASTRNIVGEVATMIGKTGDIYKSVTGETAMGTIQKLFSWGKTAAGSIIKRFTTAITA